MPRTATSTRSSATRNNNLLFNGNFETYPSTITATTSTSNKWIDGTSGGSSANTAYGWRTDILAGTGSAGFDTGTSHSGTASMKVSTLSTGSNILVQLPPTGSGPATLAPLIPVLPSTAYTATIWMKTRANSGAATSGAFLSIRTLTASNGAVATVTTTKVNTTSGSWTRYTVTFVTGSTVAYLNLILTVTGSDGTGTLIMDAWFDDIVVAPNNLSRSVATGRTQVV